MQNLKKLIELVEHKHKLDQKRAEPKYMDSTWLLNAIISEVEEVKEEIKPNNKAHLEDELSDILWGWLTLVENLKDEGLVDSHEAIFERGLKKYEERILPLYGDERDHGVWKEVKERQKKSLAIEKYRDEVREFYRPYYENSDEAHLIDHADDVCDLALEINSVCDERLVILASYIHDMYNKEQRAIHNKLAYEYVLRAEDKFLKALNERDLNLVAHAVLEHRASFKGEFYSKLSELISSADRGKPDLVSIVKRSMKFNKGNVQGVYEHIKDKYGTNGYAKYPDIFCKLFEKELKAFREEADELTVERILDICEM